MTQRGKILVVGLTALTVVGLATAQPPFPFPGRMGGGTADPIMLLRNPGIIKELKLSEDQQGQIPKAVLKALAEVLKPEQLQRLKEIELQQRGPMAFKDAQVQDSLKMTAAQKDSANNILEEFAKDQREMFKEIKGDFKAMGEKMAKLNSEARDKLLDVLTAEQKKTWKGMLGEEFKMPSPFIRPKKEK